MRRNAGFAALYCSIFARRHCERVFRFALHNNIFQRMKIKKRLASPYFPPLFTWRHCGRVFRFVMSNANLGAIVNDWFDSFWTTSVFQRMKNKQNAGFVVPRFFFFLFFTWRHCGRVFRFVSNNINFFKTWKYEKRWAASRIIFHSSHNLMFRFFTRCRCKGMLRFVLTSIHFSKNE